MVHSNGQGSQDGLFSDLEMKDPDLTGYSFCWSRDVTVKSIPRSRKDY